MDVLISAELLVLNSLTTRIKSQEPNSPLKIMEATSTVLAITKKTNMFLHMVNVFAEP